ncbi:acetyltransferase [Bacillus sp. AFS040349]|uniref:acetyltransferase n=1 Tax=Bacillus sp. AFS040349 TaxID=2033502 RepID=UPI000BFD3032|nr:acetyltransferase [Bacillus sp. AFS040349]PGT74697.1 sugar O-acyltransferase [Bacillus sp. AFS040349]
MKKLVIFGTGKTAELAHYFFTMDSDYEVVGFTVDAGYIGCNEYCGLPVYNFENIENQLSTDDVYFFAALTYTKMNEVRESKIKEAKEKGFRLASYISTKANISSNVKVGEHCFILENNNTQPFVEIGENNVLWSGNHIGHHTEIGNNNFITSHVVISGNVTIRDNCFIGVNATLRDGLVIANYTLIGAGCYINRNTNQHDLYKANYSKLSKLKSNQISI